MSVSAPNVHILDIFFQNEYPTVSWYSTLILLESIFPNTVFLVLRYTRGAWLAGHVDHTKTHVLSAIINVGQKVEEPWPLDIVDYEKRMHKVILKPGDLLWYESSR